MCSSQVRTHFLDRGAGTTSQDLVMLASLPACPGSALTLLQATKNRPTSCCTSQGAPAGTCQPDLGIIPDPLPAAQNQTTPKAICSGSSDTQVHGHGTGVLAEAPLTKSGARRLLWGAVRTCLIGWSVVSVTLSMNPVEQLAPPAKAMNAMRPTWLAGAGAAGSRKAEPSVCWGRVAAALGAFLPMPTWLPFLT